jgi:glycosyltransferase involved in cell wall biosynthesis
VGPAPEISVVIPTHNRAALLMRTLAGALAQTGVDLELIVVDDGSSDGTPERLAALAEPRLEVVRHDGARGVAHARNSGLARARGEWVGFLDDDDVWAPWKLRDQLDAAAREGAAIAYASAAIVDSGYRMIDIHRAPPADEMPEQILRRQMIPGGCSNLIVRTEIARAAGGFDPELSMLADWDMWIRLMLRGKAAHSDELSVGYVMHDTSMSLTKLDSTIAEIERVERKHADAARRHGVVMDGLGWSRWLAGRYRKSGDRRGARRAYLWGARRYRSPGNLIRVAGLQLGEAAMRAGSGRPPVELPEEPDWLALYRPGGALAASEEPTAPPRA